MYEKREASIPKGPIKVDEEGRTLERNKEHARELAKHFGLDTPGAKGVSCPGLTEHVKLEESAEDLPDAKSTGFRSAAHLAQYVAKHGMTIKYPVREIQRKASNPTEMSDLRLKRATRVLVDHGRCVMRYARQPLERVIRAKVDSGYVGNPEILRSTTCVVIQHGGHFLMGSSATQPVESLPVTESKFHAQIRGAVEGVYVRNVLGFYRHVVDLGLNGDNSASRPTLRRLGTGRKTRHIAVKFFRVQRLIKGGVVKV